MRVIEIKKTGFFTLMDWGMVLENAAEIHTVGTALNYMLDVDVLNIKCPMHIYVRRPKEVNFDNYNYLMRKEYVWHP
jgi:hypothetical protein